MKKYLKYCLSALVFILCASAYAQDIKDLTIKEKIDNTYVFGFDLRESRSAKGGIWNVKTGKAETPLSYTRMKKDTVDGKPVVMLYREVALGNHPLNRWETWVLKNGKWIDAEEDTAVDAQEAVIEDVSYLVQYIKGDTEGTQYSVALSKSFTQSEHGRELLRRVQDYSELAMNHVARNSMVNGLEQGNKQQS